MVNYNEIITRLKRALRVSDDALLAESLGMSPSNFGHKKRRGTLLEDLIVFAIDQNVNLDWLLTGEESHLKDIACQEQLTFNDSDLGVVMNMAKRVLTSGNQQASEALEKNIRYFAHAVEVEKKLNSMDDRLRAVEELLAKKAG